MTKKALKKRLKEYRAKRDKILFGVISILTLDNAGRDKKLAELKQEYEDVVKAFPYDYDVI
jgi:metal-responsive CopG/Arc/MetJ family transcriptional regulator